ncbi:MAG: M48 family metalloprotease [Planctomycetes bacterium]|nr:M48 family metalloprotease [Planctomycetota bacterium]
MTSFKTTSALALFALLALQGCVTNPVTGQREFTLVSKSQEKELGKEADPEIVAQYGAVDDPALQAYVDGIGRRLVGVSHTPEEQFTFRLLDDPIVNAFALPGGYCYVTRGILAHLNSEAALVGVLGHEVGHVTARHGANRMTNQMLLGGVLGIASQLGETAEALSGVAGAGLGLLLLKYSRDDERQSDSLGVEYGTALGYDTRDMAEFFKTLEKLSGGGGGLLPSFTSTHPDPGERYTTIRELTAKTQQPGQDYVTKRDDYLRRLEGLVFGPDPRQGFAENGFFNHPDMRFRFPVPAGWLLANGRARVTLATEKQDAAVIFQLAKERTAQAAADAFVADEGIVEQERAALTLPGGPAVRVVTQVKQQDGTTLGVVSTFAELGGKVFTFHGLCAWSALATFRPTLESVADGFQPLTDPALLAVEPAVLKIVQTKRAAPFRDQVADYPIPARAQADLERLALINGVEVDATVPAGQLLKVLTSR